MTMIKEVADTVKLIGDVVKSTREVVDAVNDGRKFLAAKHPEATQDFIDLLGQMQTAIEGLADVTKVVSAFRFERQGGSLNVAAEGELARFNDYVIQQRKDITALQNRLRDLKANCDKVRMLRDKLDASTTSRSYGSLFSLFGKKAQQRSLELASSIGEFYADDQQMIQLLRRTLQLAEDAIKDVENALGPPGTANPHNLPAAAALLGTYAVMFEKPHAELHSLADALSDARIALRA